MEPGISPGSRLWNTLRVLIRKSHTQDIESAPSDPLVPPPGEVDPDNRDNREAVVYGKLMDHLDRVHRKKRNLWCDLARMAFEILAVPGLIALLVSSLAFERFKRQRTLELRWWRWILMAMIIFGGYPVVRLVSWVILWPVTWWWRISKLVVYFVRRVKRTMDVTIWFCLVLLGWYAWFRRRFHHVRGESSALAAHQITRFLIALCLGSFMWLLKDILYMKLEADLHYRQLFDRIRRTIVNLNGILIVDTLKLIVDPSVDTPHPNGPDVEPCTFITYSTEQKWYKSMFMKIWRKEGATGDEQSKVRYIWMDVYKMNKDTVPIWILRRLEEEYLKWIKSNRPSFVDELLRDDEVLLKRANNLFKSITNNETEEIKREQLKAFKSNLKLSEKELKLSEKELKLSEQELDFLDSLFKRRSGEEKTISRHEFLGWAVRAHKSIWGLERTLRSSKLALIKLNRMLSIFLLTVVLIIYLILTGIVTTAQLALLFAPFLAASFIFENSLKNMFQGLVFVFAMHPFDVGDRVVIEDEQLRVKELNILTSVFFKYETGSDVIYPNSKLAKTGIISLDITPDQSDKLDFVVNADTPPEDVKDLEFKIQERLDEQGEFSSGTKVVKCTECPFNHTEPLKVTVHFKYLVSYLTADKKAEHKSKILEDIMKFRKEMEMNKKEYPHGHEPYHLIFTLKWAHSVDRIEDMKRKIMRCQVVREHFPGSKAVIAALGKKEVTIALYVNQTGHKGEEHFKLLSDQLIKEGIRSDATELSIKKGVRVICQGNAFQDAEEIVGGNSAISSSREIRSDGS